MPRLSRCHRIHTSGPRAFGFERALERTLGASSLGRLNRLLMIFSNRMSSGNRASLEDVMASITIRFIFLRLCSSLCAWNHRLIYFFSPLLKACTNRYQQEQGSTGGLVHPLPTGRGECLVTGCKRTSHRPGLIHSSLAPVNLGHATS